MSESSRASSLLVAWMYYDCRHKYGQRDETGKLINHGFSLQLIITSDFEVKLWETDEPGILLIHWKCRSEKRLQRAIIAHHRRCKNADGYE